jgi:hypothetical protein
MRYHEIMAEHNDSAKWTTFMVYGGFEDPATGLNFFMARMPKGRVPFQKKIVPALKRIVMSLYTDADKAAAKSERWSRGYSERLRWSIEGEPDEGVYWNLTKNKPTRYEWNGTELVNVPYDA